MVKIVAITGGSGFIGTNLIEKLIELRFDVVNIDIKEPLEKKFRKYFHCIDINDKSVLCEFLRDLSPDYVIHLAARTDLQGTNINEYKVNTLGVENICVAVSETPSIQRVLSASSMLVCRTGHIPLRSNDFSADTLYGKSKVEGEKIVMRYQKSLPSNLIFRPTSIWGPRFGSPYRDFFDLVLRRRYVKIGPKVAKKTYGYIENTVNQIISLMNSNEQISTYSIPYIGDYPPINADDWSEIISSKANIPGPTIVPYYLIALGGIIGDILSYFKIPFPLTSFRIKNMTTNNDLTRFIAFRESQFEQVTLEEGVIRTINWLNENRYEH